jgi:hypothetical protein
VCLAGRNRHIGGGYETSRPRPQPERQAKTPSELSQTRKDGGHLWLGDAHLRQHLSERLRAALFDRWGEVRT